MAPRYGPHIIAQKVEEEYDKVTVTADEITPLRPAGDVVGVAAVSGG